MSLETEIKKLREAIEANTAALMGQGQTILGTEETTSAPKKDKAPAKDKTKADETPATEAKDEPEPKKETPKADTKEVTGDDCRKVAGKLIEDGEKAAFQAVLKQFKTKSITAFEKEEGDLAAMLSALEDKAGCKLDEIPD